MSQLGIEMKDVATRSSRRGPRGGGFAVLIAARIMALAGRGEVVVSGAIPPLVVGSRITFADKGRHELKGVPDPWPVLAVRDTRG